MCNPNYPASEGDKGLRLTARLIDSALCDERIELKVNLPEAFVVRERIPS